jgi:hypothetical protein
VVAIAFGGRLVGSPGASAAKPAAAAAVPAAVAVAVAGELGSGLTEAPAAKPSLAFRSDWPAAIGARTRPRPLRREEGTDGLMGRLPFGLANDTPTVRDAIDWSTIYDERADWSKDSAALDTTPPWVRRLGGLGNYRTDPYER